MAYNIDMFSIGQTVIIRTCSAGVWFGVLDRKEGREVILRDARRMWRWQTQKSISLSGVVLHGINQAGSKICGPLSSVWLEAIEIMPISGYAAESIRNAPEAQIK